MKNVHASCDAQTNEPPSRLWWEWTGSCGIGEFLQRNLGDDRGFFGLFLPAWALPCVIPFFGVLTLLGFGLLFVALVRS